MSAETTNGNVQAPLADVENSQEVWDHGRKGAGVV